MCGFGRAWHGVGPGSGLERKLDETSVGPSARQGGRSDERVHRGASQCRWPNASKGHRASHIRDMGCTHVPRMADRLSRFLREPVHICTIRAIEGPIAGPGSIQS